MAAQIDCRLAPVTDVGQVEHAWQELQSRVDCSYFLSWGWIGTWLNQLPANLQPQLFTAVASNRIVGLGIVISRTLLRHRFIRSNAVFLNKTGDEKLDEITIEYNGLLVDPSLRVAVTEAALNFLLAHGWDEVFIDAAQAPESLLALSGNNWSMRKRFGWPALGVDLQQLRDTHKNYLDVLSSNTRYQLRRALHAYEKFGPMRIEAAQNPSDATAWFAELRRLHQMHWTGKGLPGAFANIFLDRFHSALVVNRMVHGEIQLLRIGFGEHWVGYLYGFLWNGTVSNYQCGFDYRLLEKHNWPGVVAQYAAVEFNCRQGARYYDFLGGDSQLKRTLSTVSLPLDWVVAQRSCLKFRLEDCGRLLRNRVLGHRPIRGPE